MKIGQDDPFIACAFCDAEAPRKAGLPPGWTIVPGMRAMCTDCQEAIESGRKEEEPS